MTTCVAGERAAHYHPAGSPLTLRMWRLHVGTLPPAREDAWLDYPNPNPGRTGVSWGSEHVHHGAPSFLSWRGIVFDKAHSVVPSGTRMTHGVEGSANLSSADTHTLLLHTSSIDQI